MKSDLLSKSLFIRGLQCHKSLYLHKHSPELKDETTKEKQKLFESGHEVGKLAQDLFPGGTEVPYEGLSITEQLDLTKTLFDQGKTTLYEPAFQYDGVFVKVDILHRGINGWEIYEVKGSTSAKEVYIKDIALQYYVLSGAGLPLSKAYLVHLNKEYVRQGNLEIDKLFIKKPLTQIVTGRQKLIIEEVKNQKDMLKGDLPIMDIGPYCDNPYECDFKGHCWSHIPENSVFELKRRMANKFSLYKKGYLLISEITEESMNVVERCQNVSIRTRKTYFDKDAIGVFLDTLSYPLFFLDFETYMTPIPIYDGTRPYQNIPFQYSLHFIASEYGELNHHEFLAEPQKDSRRELIESLLKNIPKSACILAYNKSFEQGVLKSLALQFPEHADHIEEIIGKMIDLMAPFRSMDIYSWHQRGSYSLKSVLPAIVTGFSYDHLEIKDGNMAMAAYEAMKMTTNTAEIERIRSNLLAYCELDTLAIVKIYEALRDGLPDHETFDEVDMLSDLSM